ncbi:Ger(x)C family spore germination protein [Paenibacillus sp. 1011MAR3C5]|uniref:Ger(x)C family spore germination protein n=1 Tax=Paenibacillus sp. 1011MAR3C5 TaxID=1675787 RepID=UPI000E6C4784|nr:Ger(x)C family spore germination protein [Paenibacillus sp. 1011MAR3C5]RJE91183.1 Ger(x)C family spore germination protein [Paenibacillus sp. 1011MAR3C5]
MSSRRVWGCMAWRRRLSAAAALVLACLLLAGCWDEVNLQDVSYISALGVDYKDGQYNIYTQMINFAAVAKTESPQPQAQKIWIGQGKGDSVLLAFYNLSRGGYTTLNLEHLKTIVVQERALGKIADVLDGLNRQRASRYTSLLYGTNEPIENIFTTENFFDQSPLNSILYMPGPHDVQYTFTRPLKMQNVVQQLREPSMTTLLPALNTTKTYWRHDSKKMNTQLIDGVFVFKNFKYQGYVLEKELPGIRWLDESFDKVFAKAGGDENEATVSVTASDHRFRIDSSIPDKAVFRLNVQLKGHVVELDGQMTEREIVDSIEKRVKEEIESTYRFGLQKGMDVYHLEHYLYRHHHSYWKRYVKGRDWMPQRDQLAEIEVNLNLTDTGKFQLMSGT